MHAVPPEEARRRAPRRAGACTSTTGSPRRAADLAERRVVRLEAAQAPRAPALDAVRLRHERGRGCRARRPARRSARRSRPRTSGSRSLLPRFTSRSSGCHAIHFFSERLAQPASRSRREARRRSSSKRSPGRRRLRGASASSRRTQTSSGCAAPEPQVCDVPEHDDTAHAGRRRRERVPRARGAARSAPRTRCGSRSPRSRPARGGCARSRRCRRAARAPRTRAPRRSRGRGRAPARRRARRTASATAPLSTREQRRARRRRAPPRADGWRSPRRSPRRSRRLDGHVVDLDVVGRRAAQPDPHRRAAAPLRSGRSPARRGSRGSRRRRARASSACQPPLKAGSASGCFAVKAPAALPARHAEGNAGSRERRTASKRAPSWAVIAASQPSSRSRKRSESEAGATRLRAAAARGSRATRRGRGDSDGARCAS